MIDLLERSALSQTYWGRAGNHKSNLLLARRNPALARRFMRRQREPANFSRPIYSELSGMLSLLKSAALKQYITQ
jgi:hypothetical protein